VNKCVSESCVFSWGSFPCVCLPCPALMRWFLFRLIIFYCVVFCCYLLEACSFLMRDRKGGREDREIERIWEGRGMRRSWEERRETMTKVIVGTRKHLRLKATVCRFHLMLLVFRYKVSLFFFFFFFFWFFFSELGTEPRFFIWLGAHSVDHTGLNSQRSTCHCLPSAGTKAWTTVPGLVYCSFEVIYFLVVVSYEVSSVRKKLKRSTAEKGKSTFVKADIIEQSAAIPGQCCRADCTGALKPNYFNGLQ